MYHLKECLEVFKRVMKERMLKHVVSEQKHVFVDCCARIDLCTRDSSVFLKRGKLHLFGYYVVKRLT